MSQGPKLSNGKVMPFFGLGTWQSKPEEVIRAVETAIDAGYRHIDTAWAYFNEKDIGTAIKNKIDQGVVKREDLFIVTKLHVQFLRPDMVRKGCQQSLSNLGLDYVDMYLIHGPMKIKFVEGNPFPVENGKLASEPTDQVACWKEMEKLYNDGLVKGIGLSNFNSKQIKRIYDAATVKPMNLQVECHMYFPQFELHDFCTKLGITFTAYAPLGSPNRAGSLLTSIKDAPVTAMEDKRVIAVAEAHKKTPAHVMLRWLIQRNIIVIPKSVTPSRIQSNFQVFDFTLTDAEMKTLNNLGVNNRTFELKGMGVEEHEEFPFSAPF